MAVDRVCLAFMRGAELANVRNLPETWAPGSLASFEVGDKWKLTVNRSRDEIDSIPGFHMAVERRGLPVGLINPRDGILAAGLEDELIADLEAAIAEITPEEPA